MSIKVYLAGGWFENEDDWRYEIVKGLKTSPIIKDSKHGPPHWGILQNAIFGCLDYVGPYPNDSLGDGPEFDLYPRAVKEADIVFAWLEDSENFDVQKVCTEIAYAGGLGKFIGTGSADETAEVHQNTWFAAVVGNAYPLTFYADSPRESFTDCLRTLVNFLPVADIVKFSKVKNSHFILGDGYVGAGYVYVIRADTGHYKIGRTNNIPARMKLFAVKLPFDFEIVYAIPCVDMVDAERQLHLIYANKRTNGEWFNLTDSDVEVIKTVESANKAREFQKRDEQGAVWGMPELWEHLPDDYYSKYPYSLE